MEKFVKSFDKSVNNALNNIIKKPMLIRGFVHLFLIIYASRLAPQLPAKIQKWFENAYVKLFVFSLILWTAQFSPSTSILIAICFMTSLNYINEQPLWKWEGMENTIAEEEDPTAAAISPSKNTALDVATLTLSQQIQDPSVVQAVAQKSDTIVVQPTVVNTPQGPAVVNPTVVVAPAIVATPDGNQLLVKPDITTLNAVKSNNEQEDIEANLIQQRADPLPYTRTNEGSATAEVQSGCYPVRRYDLTKITPYDGNADFASNVS